MTTLSRGAWVRESPFFVLLIMHSGLWAAMRHNLEVEVPDYLSRREVANKAINRFLEQVRTRHRLAQRRASTEREVCMRSLFRFFFFLRSCNAPQPLPSTASNTP